MPKVLAGLRCALQGSDRQPEMNIRIGCHRVILGLAALGLAAAFAPTRGVASSLPETVTIRGSGDRSVELCLARMVEGGEFVSTFGWRRHPMGGGGAHHDGIDIKARRGTAVRAAAEGRVVQVGWGRDFGRYVLIRHEGSFETVYAHLGRVPKTLRAGATVTPDDVIGYVGSTGRSTGPHLHFEVRRDGKPIDPITGNPARPRKTTGRATRKR